jgi:predicted ATPase
VRYLREAGVKAVARSANKEGVEFFEQALKLLDGLPETPERLAEAIDIRIALGPSLIALKGTPAPEVEASYRNAEALCRRLDDQSRLFPVLWGLWYVNTMRGRYAAARELGEGLLEVAHRGDDSGRLLEAHHALWAVLSAMGKPTTALTYLEQGLALYDRERHAGQALLYGGHDPGACCRYHLAMTRWLLGYPDQALAAGHDALKLAEQLGHPMTMVITLSFVAWIHYLRGELEAAVPHAERMAGLAKAHGFSGYLDDGAVVLASVRIVTTGDCADLGAVHQRLMTGSGARARFRHILCCCLLAEACAKADRADAGLRVFASIAEYPDAFYAPEIHRIRGELLLKQAIPALDEAEQCFTRAIDLARRRQEHSPELRATTSLARLLAERGQRNEAKQLLAPVYGWFSEGFDTSDLKAAKALLEQLA